MKIAKRLIFIVLIAMIAIGGAGCMRRMSLPEKMVDHISNKYGIKFEYDAPYGGDTNPESRKITVTTAEFPGCDILVEYKVVDGVEVFKDSFLSVKYYEQTTQLIENTIAEFVNGEYTIIRERNLDSLFGEESANMSFDEYIAEDESRLKIVLVVDANTEISDRESFEQRVGAAFMNSGLNCYVRMYIDNGVWDFETGDKYAIGEYNLDHGFAAILSFDVDSINGMSNVIWED